MTIETPFRNIIDLQNALTDLSHDIDDICVHGRSYHFAPPTLPSWRTGLSRRCLVHAWLVR